MSGTLEFVVSWHAEDAAMLWVQRSIAAHAVHFRLASLRELDHRLDAHLDGLVVNGQDAWEAARSELRWAGSGEVFTAAALAMLTDATRLDDVFAAADQQEHLEQAIADAMCWMTNSVALPLIDRFSASSEDSLARVGTLAQVGLRLASAGQLLQAASSKCERLRIVALQGLGATGAVGTSGFLGSQLMNESPAQKLAAAMSLARLARNESAGRLLQQFVESLQPDSSFSEGEGATIRAVSCLDRGDAANWIEMLGQHCPQSDWAIAASAALGDPTLLEWLLVKMQIPELSRQAGQAFAQITGLDLVQDGLEEDAPAGFQAGPSEDPHSDDVAMDPYERWPWPDPAKLANWLARHRASLQRGNRYFLGELVDEPVLEKALRVGTQRQRAAAAEELGLRTPAQPLFNVQLRVERQIAALKNR